MLRRIVLPLLAVVLLIWVAGCSDNSDDSGITSSETGITDEFGGYTATSEEPGFGNEDLLGEDAGNVEYDDPILVSSEVQAITEDVEAGLFHFRAVWGQLDYDSTFTTETDWTGSLSITRGAEVIRRIIRFETGQDYILERTSKELIEWHSITTVHNDGIAVDIFVPPILPTYDTTLIIDDDGMGNVDTTIVVDTVYPEVEPVTVSFETGPYSRTFTLNDLVSLDTVVELDDGNAIAFQAMQFYRFSCPRGFIAGRWAFNNEYTGVFEGIWMTRHGYISGYVEGTFEKNEEGEKVFYGKWISRNGEFEGLLKGNYGSYVSSNSSLHRKYRKGGWIKGNIYDADGIEIGALKGRYSRAIYPINDYYLQDQRFFQARWKLYCNDITDEIYDGINDMEIDYDQD